MLFKILSFDRVSQTIPELKTDYLPCAKTP